MPPGFSAHLDELSKRAGYLKMEHWTYCQEYQGRAFGPGNTCLIRGIRFFFDVQNRVRQALKLNCRISGVETESRARSLVSDDEPFRPAPNVTMSHSVRANPRDLFLS